MLGLLEWNQTFSRFGFKRRKSNSISLRPLCTREPSLFLKKGPLMSFQIVKIRLSVLLKLQRSPSSPSIKFLLNMPTRKARETNLQPYWRQVHEDFFTEWMREAGLTFTPDSKVVLEEFRKVYPLQTAEGRKFWKLPSNPFSKAKHDIISLFEEELKLLNLDRRKLCKQLNILLPNLFLNTMIYFQT